jgi:hypothetical protein
MTPGKDSIVELRLLALGGINLGAILARAGSGEYLIYSNKRRSVLALFHPHRG